jgi:hypothetical protein
MTICRWQIAACTAVLFFLDLETASAQQPVPPPTVASASAETLRTWTETKGQQHSGQLLAYDKVRATLKLGDGRVVFVSPQSLSANDQQHLEQWRKDHPEGAWINATHMPPWPNRAGTGPVKVAAVSTDPAQSRYIYHSPNFAIKSDVSLPLNTIADMATSFEATREAMLRLPLGLAAKPLLPPKYRNAMMFRYGPDGRIYQLPLADQAASESKTAERPATPRRLPVELYITPQAYGLAGGASGTGGYYSSWRRTMLISLQNFGINIDENKRVTLNYRDKLFILRHEVSHQTMRDWLPHIPIWLSEGIAEYLAAVPYQAGRYQFQNLEKPFLAYLNKWRFEEDPHTIPMMHPSEILKMTPQDWQGALNMNAPVLNYNSAALLTWYFLHQDDDANAAHLAAYFDAVRQRPQDALALVQTHLLRGRTPEKIAMEIRAAWKKFAVEIVFQ